MGRVPAALRACGASLVLVLATSVAGLAGCAAQCQEHFASVREGMDKDQVQALLGKPSSKWPGERPGEEGTERWQYGDNLSSLATSGVFRDADTSRVYVIWFDKDGKVASFSEPDWARER